MLILYISRGWSIAFLGESRGDFEEVGKRGQATFSAETVPEWALPPLFEKVACLLLPFFRIKDAALKIGF